MKLNKEATYTERTKYRGDYIVLQYTVVPPENDLGVKGGVCIDWIEGYTEGSEGPQGIPYDQMCEELADEIAGDLGL